MNLEELQAEIANRKPIVGKPSRFHHVKERMKQRFGEEIDTIQYQEITECIRRGEALCYGVFFQNDRRFDRWYRAFLGGKELLVIFDDKLNKPTTVLPVNAKERMEKAFRREYGEHIPIKF